MNSLFFKNEFFLFFFLSHFLKLSSSNNRRWGKYRFVIRQIYLIPSPNLLPFFSQSTLPYSSMSLTVIFSSLYSLSLLSPSPKSFPLPLVSSSPLPLVQPIQCNLPETATWERGKMTVTERWPLYNGLTHSKTALGNQQSGRWLLLRGYHSWSFYGIYIQRIDLKQCKLD